MALIETVKSKLLSNENSFPSILGQDQAKRQIKSAFLVGRHIILIGPPGIGKTTLARDLLRLLPEPEDGQKEERFVRVQGSPDLTVEDLLGDIDPIKALKYGPLSEEAFTPGKIFKANKGILFFDEVNRCPEKLQNALLQVLEEGKATIGSYDVDMEADFLFIGTMNPEDSSTEKLSDVFLDRFDLVYGDYPEKMEIEKEIVLAKGEKLDVEFPPELLEKLVYYVRHLRADDNIKRKPSVRATLGLYERAQANAKLSGKGTVDLRDVHEAVISVLAHRIEMKPSLKYLQQPADYLSKDLKKFLDTYEPALMQRLDESQSADAEEQGDGL